MKEIAIVRIQRRPTGSFMVTIPIEVIRSFDIKSGDKAKVLVEHEPKRIVYELIREEQK